MTKNKDFQVTVKVVHGGYIVSESYTEEHEKEERKNRWKEMEIIAISRQEAIEEVDRFLTEQTFHQE